MRIFFATDLHGSTQVFKKALAATARAEADVFLLGGDLSGKQLVPLLRRPEGRFLVMEPYRENDDGFMVERVRGEEISGNDLSRFTQRLEAKGYYWHLVEDEREIQLLNEDEGALRRLGNQKIFERIEAWSKLALEGLPSGVQCIWSGGNDDENEMLDRATALGNAAFCHSDGASVSIDDYTIISFGYSNHTPFGTPREMSEEGIYDSLSSLATVAGNAQRLILNVHVPPYGAGNLDLCAEYEPMSPGAGALIGDTDGAASARKFRPTGRMVHVGSRGVSRFIAERQPLADFVGHVHEGKGSFRMGRTQVFNPGSDYNAGILQAFLVSIIGTEVRHYSHVRD